MDIQVGDRVIAISHSKRNGDDSFTYFLFGEGEYLGNIVPDPDDDLLGSFGESLRENRIGHPKILLDSGQVVWGCECWWSKLEEWQSSLENASAQVNIKIEYVDIEESRARREA